MFEFITRLFSSSEEKKANNEDSNPPIKVDEAGLNGDDAIKEFLESGESTDGIFKSLKTAGEAFIKGILPDNESEHSQSETLRLTRLENARQKNIKLLKEQIEKIPIQNYIDNIAKSWKNMDELIYHLFVLTAAVEKIKSLFSFLGPEIDFFKQIHEIYPELKISEEFQLDIKQAQKLREAFNENGDKYLNAKIVFNEIFLPTTKINLSEMPSINEEATPTKLDFDLALCKYITTKTSSDRDSIALKMNLLFPITSRNKVSITEERINFENKITNYKKENPWEVLNAQLHLSDNKLEQKIEAANQLIQFIYNKILHSNWEISKIGGGKEFKIDTYSNDDKKTKISKIVKVPANMAEMIRLINEAKANLTADPAANLKVLPEILKIASLAEKKQPLTCFGLKRDPKAQIFYQQLAEQFTPNKQVLLHEAISRANDKATRTIKKVQS